MNKFIIPITVCLLVTACGQKGPLIVDRSLNQKGQAMEGEANSDSNETEARLNSQLEGQPTIIYR